MGRKRPIRFSNRLFTMAGSFASSPANRKWRNAFSPTSTLGFLSSWNSSSAPSELTSMHRAVHKISSGVINSASMGTPCGTSNRGNCRCSEIWVFPVELDGFTLVVLGRVRMFFKCFMLGGCVHFPILSDELAVLFILPATFVHWKLPLSSLPLSPVSSSFKR